MTDRLPDARSFGGSADAYDRGRPSYSANAAAWLTSAEPLTVLELGAGTGKLTKQLVALGHDVHATEPDPAMLEILRRRLPGVRTSATSAEDIPASDRSYDVVVAAQCFHWFDLPVALPEIARVLKTDGHLAVAWNERNEKIPWVKKLGRIIGTQDQLRDPSAALTGSRLFAAAESESFAVWQSVDQHSILDLVRSRSNIAALDEAEREARLAEVSALYVDYGRGRDGMQLPYATRCFRARVVDRPDPEGLVIERGDADADVDDGRRNDDDSGMLLIDFR